jgi:hypothetical protein
MIGCRLARLTINGRVLVSSIPNFNFDSTLNCVDTTLPIGWQNVHVDYAGESLSNIQRRDVGSKIILLLCHVA